RSVKQARRAALEGLVESLNRIADHAAGRQVDIWLENLCNYTKNHPFYYVFTNREEYDFVLDRVQCIKCIFDVSHAHVNGGDPVGSFIEFKDRIVALAFSDNLSNVDSHMPLGNGNVDFHGLISKILQIGWRGVVSFETRGSDLSHSVNYLNEVVADIHR